MDFYVRTSVDEIYEFDLPCLSDERGHLTVFEEFPFDVKRIYYLHGVSACQSRGGRAHKNLAQIFIAIAGSVDISFDDGSKKRRFEMSDPCKALYVPAGLWRELFNFSTACACLVLGSATYDESDYLRNFDLFLTWKTR